jgi:hypothetical protein
MSSMISQFLSDTGNAVPVVIVGGGVVGVYRVSRQAYRRTWGSRRDLEGRLNQLATGVSLRYVEERFGTPAFTRAFTPAMPLPAPAAPARKLPVRALVQALADPRSPEARRGAFLPVQPGPPDGQVPERQIRELIFRERHAWVQILVDENDAVLRFSITVTDPKFAFSVELLTWDNLRIRLGKNTFADVDAGGFNPEGRSMRVGAHNYEYAESYWFGNPGQYQRYVISHNEIGAGKFRHRMDSDDGPGFFRTGTLACEYQPEPGNEPEFDPEAPYARRFRAGTTINTLTVLRPWGNLVDLAESRGPDSNHVRVLLPQGGERRQLRRRMKEIRVPREGLRANE